jgi:hypothetical protein
MKIQEAIYSKEDNEALDDDDDDRDDRQDTQSNSYAINF